MPENLRKGREFFRKHEWHSCYECLSLADIDEPLSVEDLEKLATSAYLIGQDSEFHEVLQRAYRSYLESREDEPAARCAFWIGLMLMLRGETGQASGWLTRARRLVEGRNCVESGYLMLPVAEEYLATGDTAAAHAIATGAVKLGDEFNDADLMACARHLQGRALIKQEQVQTGLELLDEAMLAVIAGELSPIVTGLIYCSLIEACQEVYAWSRAREWTDALAQWCEQQPQLVAFTGVCLVHRAQIMQLRGAWPDAMAETKRACERASQQGEFEPPALAVYQQAELHRLRGELALADEAYREVARLGSEPQPGLALLRLKQHRLDAACVGIRRVLHATGDFLQRARFLPAYIEIMLALGEVNEARRASKELVEIADKFGTDMLQAMAAHAVGSVDLAAGDVVAALGSLRRAFEMWRQLDAPYDSARARMLIGRACRSIGDDEAAELEFEAATTVFETLGAATELPPDRAAGEAVVSAVQHPLTPREIQVLRLVATGKTNKEISQELFVSERTIDRHVSNILTKLEVSSRAAATAYAFRNDLI